MIGRMLSGGCRANTLTLTRAMETAEVATYGQNIGKTRFDCVRSEEQSKVQITNDLI